MNLEEKEALKKEILDELEDRFKGAALREDTQGILADARNKWCTDEKSSNRQSPMYEAFGTITYWKVWELIRKLTCLICGCGYVRHLAYIQDREKVNRIADILCKTVYELRIEFLE